MNVCVLEGVCVEAGPDCTLTFLQLCDPLQQLVEGGLSALAVGRGLVVQLRLLLLQLRHFAQELLLQLAQPALQHLAHLAGVRCRGPVHPNLLLHGKEMQR